MQLPAKNNAFGRQSHNFRFAVGYLSKNKQVSNAKQPQKKCFIVNELLLPQFRSIIPCEVLLYIEVTFLGFIH